MSRNHIRIIFVCIVLFIENPVAHAVELAGGTGTHDDPYQIATAEQLLSIRTLGTGMVPGGEGLLPLDKHFVLVDNIDLDPNLSQDYVLHQPLVEWFSGVFDGNGFRIRHLTLEGTEGKDLGLFRWIGPDGEVRHLILEDIRVVQSSDNDSAGTVCVGNHGFIYRCSVTGVLSGSGDIGGLAKWNYGTIEECRSICTLMTEGSGGGLLFTNKGLVRNCYASGRVSAEGYAAGGLVADGHVGAIHQCYAVCQVDPGAVYTGGLVGYVRTSGMGGSADVSSSYFLDPCDGGGPNNGLGTPLTRAQMRQQTSFFRWGFAAPENRFSMPWGMSEGAPTELAWLVLKTVPTVKGLSVDEAEAMLREAGFQIGATLYDFDHAVEIGRVVTSLPYRVAPPGTMLQIVVSSGFCTWPADPGKGTAKFPYYIFSAGQLDCLAYQPELWSSHFSLESDLDMTGRVYGRSLLGGSVQPILVSDRVFNGVFKGNGHVIRNLTVEVSPVQKERIELLGLFGATGYASRIEDLGLEWVSIKGLRSTTGSAGMLCALNQGHIDRCYSRGVLEWRGSLGGLVGENTHEINDCYAEGSVKSTGERDASGAYAGLVARHYSIGSINMCYAACTVPALGHGLVAVSGSRPAEHCLWDVEVSGAERSAGGTGLGTREMMEVQVLKDHGWGSSPRWIFDDGRDYPRLAWEKSRCGVPWIMAAANPGRND